MLQGQADRVSWVLSVAPTVLVQLGQRAAAAALEGGYEGVAQLIMDAGMDIGLCAHLFAASDQVYSALVACLMKAAVMACICCLSTSGMFLSLDEQRNLLFLKGLLGTARLEDLRVCLSLAAWEAILAPCCW